jgi:glycosyltransferase involved in cell wall biosynthesis
MNQNTNASTVAPRRRVLLSAFACSPQLGSEPGVGWRWAIELASRHDVTVITHSYFRSHIDAELAVHPRTGLAFEYYEVPNVRWHPHRQLNSRLYYWWWQYRVRPFVRNLLARRPHDLIHHLTWSSYRLPSFLGGLGAPVAVGPIGGGEGAPTRLYRSWPWRERLFYRLRALSIVLSRFDPFVQLTMARAHCVLAKTRETRAALPQVAWSKTYEACEIGVTTVAAPRARRWPRATSEPLRLLYAGRLLGGKGVVYAVDCVAELRRRGVAVRLTLAGDGRLESWLRQRIAQAGLEEHVDLLGQVPREEMDALYDNADLFVFPSWHDSGGTVVTESLARGLPVVCLDLGGPRYVVDEHCALIVRTDGLDEHGVAVAMADRIEPVARDGAALARMSEHALRRAHELTWDRQVARAYDLIERHLGWHGLPSAAMQSAAA